MKSAGIMKYLMRPIDIEASQFSKAPHSFSEFVTGIYQTSIVRIIDAVITVLDIEMIFKWKPLHGYFIEIGNDSK